MDLRILGNGSYSENPLVRDTPAFFANTETNLLTRFFASLKAQIEAEQYAKTKAGARCELNNVWVQEITQNHKDHSHVALMLNKDSYYSLGNYNHPGSLAWMIKKSWTSALGLNT